MANIIIGSLLLLFTVPFFLVLLTLGEFIHAMFMFIFVAVGGTLLFSGIKAVVRNRKTSKYGEECYGLVKDILQTGTYVNGNPEYKAVVSVFVPSLNVCEPVSEVIGFNYNKYPIGSFVKVKYYHGDINFVSSIYDASGIPSDIQEHFKNEISSISSSNTSSFVANNDVEVYGNPEKIVINGVTYVRKDKI